MQGNYKLIELTRLMAETPKGKEYLEDVNCLLRQLSENNARMTQEVLLGILDSSADTFLAVIDLATRRIIGMAITHLRPATYGLVLQMEDLVVDGLHRRQGISRSLYEEVLTIARQSRADFIEWTSRPTRIAANEFYQKMGHVPDSTNAYCHSLLA